MERSDEVRDAMLRFYDRVSAGDVDSYDELVSGAPGTVAVGTAPGEIHRDRVKLRAGFEAEGLRIEAGAELEGWAEGTVGWVLDEPVFSFPGAAAVRTRLTAVLHRETDRWKVVQTHVSVGVPDEEVQDLQARWSG